MARIDDPKSVTFVDRLPDELAAAARHRQLASKLTSRSPTEEGSAVRDAHRPAH
jgi:hypothetical protein